MEFAEWQFEKQFLTTFRASISFQQIWILCARTQLSRSIPDESYTCKGLKALRNASYEDAEVVIGEVNEIPRRGSSLSRRQNEETTIDIPRLAELFKRRSAAIWAAWPTLGRIGHTSFSAPSSLWPSTSPSTSLSGSGRSLKHFSGMNQHTCTSWAESIEKNKAKHECLTSLTKEVHAITSYGRNPAIACTSKLSHVYSSSTRLFCSFTSSHAVVVSLIMLTSRCYTKQNHGQNCVPLSISKVDWLWTHMYFV